MSVQNREITFQAEDSDEFIQISRKRFSELEQSNDRLKIKVKTTENNLNKENAILKQKIEIYELQIKEAKSREENLKKMNNTFMLTLNDINSESKSNNTTNFTNMLDKHSQEITEQKNKQTQMIKNLENKNKILQENFFEKELIAKEIQHSFEKKTLQFENITKQLEQQKQQLEQDIYSVKEENKHLLNLFGMKQNFQHKKPQTFFMLLQQLYQEEWQKQQNNEISQIYYNDFTSENQDTLSELRHNNSQVKQQQLFLSTYNSSENPLTLVNSQYGLQKQRSNEHEEDYSMNLSLQNKQSTLESECQQCLELKSIIAAFPSLSKYKNQAQTKYKTKNYIFVDGEKQDNIQFDQTKPYDNTRLIQKFLEDTKEQQTILEQKLKEKQREINKLLEKNISLKEESNMLNLKLEEAFRIIQQKQSEVQNQDLKKRESENSMRSEIKYLVDKLVKAKDKIQKNSTSTSTANSFITSSKQSCSTLRSNQNLLNKSSILDQDFDNYLADKLLKTKNKMRQSQIGSMNNSFISVRQSQNIPLTQKSPIRNPQMLGSFDSGHKIINLVNNNKENGSSAKQSELSLKRSLDMLSISNLKNQDNLNSMRNSNANFLRTRQNNGRKTCTFLDRDDSFL